MTPRPLPGHCDRARDRLSSALFRLAQHVAAPDRTARLPRCPDCQIGPDLGEGVACLVCRDEQEAQMRESAIALDSYNEGWHDAQRMANRHD